MNFLELCQDFVKEVGIGGGQASTPTAVTGQSGELANVVRWIRDSHTYVCNIWVDWKFLWFEHEVTLAAASREPTMPVAPLSVRKWDRQSCYLNYGTATSRQQCRHWRGSTKRSGGGMTR